MNAWLDTVCAITANDLGTRANTVRFLLNDFMDIAHRAYNEAVPASIFAQELLDLLR